MQNQKLEMLISGFLDGSLTPQEQSLLQAQLQSNPEAARLMENLRNIDDQTALAFKQALAEGNSFENIFERACLNAGRTEQKKLRFNRPLTFAAGLAAGLLIGLALNLGLSELNNNSETQSPQDTFTAQNLLQSPLPAHDVIPENLTLSPPRTTNNVDLYHFTSRTGDQWLIEGYRSNVTNSAAQNNQL